ncbi:unnamed protein product [Urochloa humidicola]
MLRPTPQIASWREADLDWRGFSSSCVAHATDGGAYNFPRLGSTSPRRRSINDIVWLTIRLPTKIRFNLTSEPMMRSG